MVPTKYLLFALLFSASMIQAADKYRQPASLIKKELMNHPLVIESQRKELRMKEADKEAQSLTSQQIQQKFNEQAAFFREFANTKHQERHKALWGDQKRPKTVPVAAKPTRPSYQPYV
ncbi:MAG TPA: hypothetical protein VFF04_04980 [Candidatus Babeliales bacterium]|nr:hypothetical protein [Candidatus Babeliales bacterium]